LRRQLVDRETGEVVEAPDQVKGYEIGKRDYVIIEDEEIESVAIESTHTIDIETFVPRAEIDDVYIDQPYYLTPDGRVAEEAFAVIREAMREKQVVGIGRVVLYRRERPIMLEPRGKGLVARTLRYAYEVREDREYFEDVGEVAVGDEMLDLATHIIARKLSHFDPQRFEDRYQNALIELIKAKTGHRQRRSTKRRNRRTWSISWTRCARASPPRRRRKSQPPRSRRPEPSPMQRRAGRHRRRSGRMRASKRLDREI
jgi:DNA end-binding protein Ku